MTVSPRFWIGVVWAAVADAAMAILGLLWWLA
jgi:hypothetical protein